MTFSISVLSVGFTEKEILDLFLRKSEKCLCENEILCFVLLAIEEKIVAQSTVRLLGISAEIILIFKIDFKSFQVFLMLFQLVSK